MYAFPGDDVQCPLWRFARFVRAPCGVRSGRVARSAQRMRTANFVNPWHVSAKCARDRLWRKHTRSERCTRTDVAQNLRPLLARPVFHIPPFSSFCVFPVFLLVFYVSFLLPWLFLVLYMFLLFLVVLF